MLSDTLSRRPPTDINSTDKKDINEFIKQTLIIRQKICPISLSIKWGDLERISLRVEGRADEIPHPMTLNPTSQYSQQH